MTNTERSKQETRLVDLRQQAGCGGYGRLWKLLDRAIDGNWPAIVRCKRFGLI